MATGNSFKLGERVQLNVGGPTMSVKRITTGTPPNYECQWFAGKKLDSGIFAPEQLVRVTDDDAA
ncbi:putative small protein [Variovorax sp. PBL-H6]|uniref:YodC family protein n=1 Tax=Variovorax sp. PBL-H6 TaxID=434009 RepID=UPI001318D930|nr:DUF2158 domain-containing protein [Variovorax sp. PBL-H6]VTU22942.1 putative small protein [Variovorax sp. PBL-H6]